MPSIRQSGVAFDHEFTQTPLAKHVSFSGSLVAEVSSLFWRAGLVLLSAGAIRYAKLSTGVTSELGPEFARRWR